MYFLKNDMTCTDVLHVSTISLEKNIYHAYVPFIKKKNEKYTKKNENYIGNKK
jgi:hypothetical protein